MSAANQAQPDWPDTQALEQADYQDEEDLADSAKGWCRLTSISSNIDNLKPPLNIPSAIIITEDVFRIGRAADNDLVVSHLGVSGLHLEIRRSQHSRMCTLCDRSTNGTWVNGTKLVRGMAKEIDFGSKIEVLRVNDSRVAFTIGDAQATHALLHDKYIIRRDLGSGAYADVKLAMDPNSGYQYAIKMIEKSKMGLNRNTTTEQLLDEVRILQKINHHAVVNIHDYFANESRFYIVLDYLPAGDLLEYLVARKQPFNESDAMDIFCQLTEAVHYLHSNNIVHRDIKPENILLDDREIVDLRRIQHRAAMAGSSQNGQSQQQQPGSQSQKFDLETTPGSKLYRESTRERYGISSKLSLEYARQPELGTSGLRVKLTDFGLSKATHTRSARLKTICGTPQYLAPEVLQHFNPAQPGQAQERSYGKEIDVWSLGAILFVLLTINTPFPESTLMAAALKGEYERHRLRHHSEAVNDIIAKMLTVDPQRRITTQQIFEHPWCAELFASRARNLEEKKRRHELEANKTILDGDGNQVDPAAAPSQGVGTKRRAQDAGLPQVPGDHDDKDGGDHHDGGEKTGQQGDGPGTERPKKRPGPQNGKTTKSPQKKSHFDDNDEVQLGDS